MHWQFGPAGPAQYVMLLFGGLAGVNLSLALAHLPSVDGWILVVTDLVIAGWITLAWVRSEGFSSDASSSRGLTQTALLVALSPLLHLGLAGETNQITCLVIAALAFPWVFHSLAGLSAALACIVSVWAVVAAVAAPASSAAMTTTTVLLAAVFAFSYGVLLRNHRADLRREDEQRRRVVEGELYERKQRSGVLERERIAVEAASNGYWYLDLTTGRIQLSDSWAAMLGYSTEELGNDRDTWFSRVHPQYLPKLQEALSAHLYGKTENFQSQYRIKHRDGTYVWVLNRGVALRDAEGTPIAVAGSQIDITQLVDVEKSIVDDAYRDRLTSLPNREAFLIRLEQAVDHAKQRELQSFAVMFLDLDRFKVVNDSLGHLIGDQLLAAVSTRLRDCLRQARGDLIARFGGDEFVVLIEELESQPGTGEVLKIAERMVHVMEDPFRLGEHEIRTGVSVGIAFWDSGVVRAEDLLRNADTAMYHAKSQGRGRIEFFNSNMHQAALRLNQLQNDLVKAVEREELLLHFQPVVSTSTGKIDCAEALIRWRHSGGTMIGPSEFIPIAEESGQIEAIGEWALRAACEQSIEWSAQGLPPIKICVNVSPHQLADASFPQTVDSVLAATGLDPALLELEITETALMGNVEKAGRTIKALMNAGVSVALDDFGTGYSSLEHLRSFNFRTLKMDRSFVAALTIDDRAAAVARGLINLAHELDLSVTAEGVEAGEQLKFLKDHSCDRVQGFYASRPLEPTTFADLLKRDESLYPAEVKRTSGVFDLVVAASA